eukprot:7112707-Prymnesium_polylepis.1
MLLEARARYHTAEQRLDTAAAEKASAGSALKDAQARAPNAAVAPSPPHVASSRARTSLRLPHPHPCEATPFTTRCEPG